MHLTSQKYHLCRFLKIFKHYEQTTLYCETCNYYKSEQKSLSCLPNIKNGAARFIPMNGTPTYMQKPNAERVPITADMTPNKPNSGFDLTQSVIIQVTTQNAIINPIFIEKNGITELVFDSSSRSKVSEVKRWIVMSGN